MSRVSVMCWMIGLSAAAGDIRAANSQLLELMAWCAFANRDMNWKTDAVPNLISDRNHT